MERQDFKYIIGIDEVGRGSIAGPVAVGAVRIDAEIAKQKEESGWFDGLRDSKKLTALAREKWFYKITEAQQEGWLEYEVIFSRVTTIDEKGIVPAIRSALVRSLRKFKSDPKETLVLLDGGLKAPRTYKNQETIIKGDEKEVAIALASIAAKVTRDNRMRGIAKRTPKFDLKKHKGYGTRAHYEAIKHNGITKHHRKSFLKGVVE